MEPGQVECSLCNGWFIGCDADPRCPACRNGVDSCFECGRCQTQVRCAMDEGWSNCVRCGQQLCDRCRNCWCLKCFEQQSLSTKEVKKNANKMKKTERKARINKCQTT